MKEEMTSVAQKLVGLIENDAKKLAKEWLNDLIIYIF